MESVVYQRPREKLRDRGVSALTTVELIQLIIGSGSKRSSAARIAKNIARLFNASFEVSYEEVRSVYGVGDAKATQIIAAIELGKRFQEPTSPAIPSEVSFLELKQTPRLCIKYFTIDGKGDCIKCYLKKCDDQNGYLTIKAMFTDALHDAAASLTVGVGSRTQNVASLNDHQLSMLKMIFDTSSLLDINVSCVWFVNNTAEVSFSRKDLQ